jgi:uridine phosphorylase
MEMEASALFVISSLRGVKAGFIGVCYANRFRQSEGGKVDLSVNDPRREVIEVSVNDAIDITLRAVKRMYLEDLVQ